MRTAIYARYSSDLSRNAQIEYKIRLCRAFAHRKDWNVVALFEDGDQRRVRATAGL